VDAGVEEQPPVFHQRPGPAVPLEALGVGAHEQEQGIGQGAVDVGAQLAEVGDAQEGVAADDVTLAVRHLESEAGKAAVLLDDAAEDARRDEQGGGVGPAEEALEFGGRQDGRGGLVHRGSFLAGSCASSYPGPLVGQRKPPRIPV
jgi:hypothetical protein